MLETRRLAPLILLAACSGDTAPSSAKATVEYAIQQLAEARDPGVLWELLPLTYREDIHEWCRQLAANLPGDAYDKFFILLHKIGILLKIKGRYLARFGPMKYAMQLLGQADADDIVDMFTRLGDVQLLIASSGISSVQKLQAIDVGGFLHDTGSRILLHASRAYKVTGNDAAAKLQSVQLETVTSSSTHAELRITYDGTPVSVKFQRVEGRWIPTALATQWPALRTSVSRTLARLREPEIGRMFESIEEQLDAAIEDVDKLRQTHGRRGLLRALDKMTVRYGKALRRLSRFW